MNSNKSAVVVVMLFTSWMNSTLAADISSGLIEIQGALTESICDINQQQNQLTVICNQSSYTQSRVSILSSHIIPASIGQSDILWLDDQQQRGIMTVSYN